MFDQISLEEQNTLGNVNEPNTYFLLTRVYKLVTGEENDGQ